MEGMGEGGWGWLGEERGRAVNWGRGQHGSGGCGGGGAGQAGVCKHRAGWLCCAAEYCSRVSEAREGGRWRWRQTTSAAASCAGARAGACPVRASLAGQEGGVASVKNAIKNCDFFETLRARLKRKCSALRQWPMIQHCQLHTRSVFMSLVIGPPRFPSSLHRYSLHRLPACLSTVQVSRLLSSLLSCFYPRVPAAPSCSVDQLRPHVDINTTTPRLPLPSRNVLPLYRAGMTALPATWPVPHRPLSTLPAFRAHFIKQKTYPRVPSCRPHLTSPIPPDRLLVVPPSPRPSHCRSPPIHHPSACLHHQQF